MALSGTDLVAYESLVVEKIWEIDPDKLLYAFRNSHFKYASHMIVITGPSPNRRDEFENRIASRRIFELLWEVHLKARVSDVRHFYDLFRAKTTTAADAGWVFEFRMHQVLREKRTIQLFPITQDHPGPVNFIYTGHSREKPIDIHLAGSDEHLLVEKGELYTNRYYRPKPVDHPAVDSLLLVHPPGSPPILLMFQITRKVEEHGANEGDLCRINNLDLPEITRKYYVAATPEDIEPKIKIPRGYDGTGAARLPDAVLRVLNYPVSLGTLFSAVSD